MIVFKFFVEKRFVNTDSHLQVSVDSRAAELMHQFIVYIFIPFIVK